MEDNDKVCSETKNDIIHTSKITKGIKRTLNTAAYETIVIENTIEEEITWKTLEERDRKIQKWESVFVDDFKRSHDSILEELGLSHKKAYFKKVSPETVERYSKKDPVLQLDGMDTLDIG